MSKTVTIPTGGGNPFVVILGGVKYVYKPGETVEVPDGVALEIEEWERWHEKYYGENEPPFGAGGGSDWNQNAPNAPDYVKNRTHYEEFKTIIEEREVRAWIMGGEFDASRMPQVGEKLTVTLNGNTYKCTVWESRQEGEVCLGNGDFDRSDRGENVPFFAAFWVGDEGGAGAAIATAMIGENTISIVDDSGNTLLEETFNIEINVDEPMYSVDFSLDQPLIVGSTYKVVYDGAPYECVAWEDSGAIHLGNGEIDGYEHSEDVPFLIGTFPSGDGWLWYLVFYGGSHTVFVSGNTIRKLDEKYLPYSVMKGIENAQATAENAQTTAENAFSNALKHYQSNPAVNFTSDGDCTYTASLSGSSEVIVHGCVRYPAAAEGFAERYATLYINDAYVGVVFGQDSTAREEIFELVEYFKLKVLGNTIFSEQSPKELGVTGIPGLRVVGGSAFAEGIKSIKLVFNQSDTTISNTITSLKIYSTIG